MIGPRMRVPDSWSPTPTPNEMIDAKELREMSDEQLALTLADAADQLFRLRIQSQTERLDAPTELRLNRRLIARAKTIQTERALAAATAAATSATATATATAETDN